MRKRLFVLFMWIFLFGVLITGYTSYGFARNLILNSTLSNLKSEAMLIEEYIEASDRPVNFSSIVYKLGKRTGKRITIIREDGRVVGESQSINLNMENHSTRPEVVDALKNGEGTATRMSATEKVTMYYYASKFKVDGANYVLRLSVDFNDIRSIQARYLKLAIFAIVGGIIVSAILVYGYIDMFTRPIRLLTRTATTIALGQYEKRINISSNDEIGQLGHAFDMMADRLQETIEDLSNKRNNLFSILTSMDDGVIVIDNNEKIILINPAARKLFGIDGDVSGKYLIEAIRNYDFQDIVKNFPDEEVELSINYPAHRLLKVKATRVVDHDKSSQNIGIMLFIQDITRIKAFENMRSDFVANVSHELKSPLTSIKGFAETLRYVDDIPTRDRFLDIINVEAERLTRLINDILTLSELENKDFSVNFEKIDVKESIFEVCNIMEPAAREKQISIETSFSEDTLCIYGDRDKFKQMMINLMDNGIKYTNNGGKLWVSAARKDKDISIFVEDNGMGVPEEDIPRLFERFYRVDKGRSRKMGGTGLGLAIVKHIVMIFNGDISVSSAQGKGTKFTILLPSAD